MPSNAISAFECFLLRHHRPLGNACFPVCGLSQKHAWKCHVYKFHGSQVSPLALSQPAAGGSVEGPDIPCAPNNTVINVKLCLISWITELTKWFCLSRDVKLRRGIERPNGALCCTCSRVVLKLRLLLIFEGIAHASLSNSRKSASILGLARNRGTGPRTDPHGRDRRKDRHLLERLEAENRGLRNRAILALQIQVLRHVGGSEVRPTGALKSDAFTP